MTIKGRILTVFLLITIGFSGGLFVGMRHAPPKSLTTISNGKVKVKGQSNELDYTQENDTEQKTEKKKFKLFRK